MPDPLDLKSLEQDIYAESWTDGLLDLLAGAGLASIGVAWLFDLVALGPIAPVVLASLWPGLRKRITEPRMGVAVPGAERRGTERTKLWVLLAAGVFTLLLGITVYVGTVRGGPTPLLTVLVPGLPAFLMAIAAGVAASLLHQARFPLYGVALVLGGALVIATDVDPGVGLRVGGVAALINGLRTLWVFLRSHPVPS